METVITIVTTALAVFVSVFSYYLSIKRKVKDVALEMINTAEVLNVSGKEKMEFAVNAVYEVVPSVAKPFITRDFVESTIQIIFDEVKAFAEKQK